MGMGPGRENAIERSSDQAERLAKERLDQRLDAALQRGWSIRWDPTRLEYTASRDLVVERTLPKLLDQVDAADQVDEPDALGYMGADAPRAIAARIVGMAADQQ